MRQQVKFEKSKTFKEVLILKESATGTKMFLDKLHVSPILDISIHEVRYSRISRLADAVSVTQPPPRAVNRLRPAGVVWRARLRPSLMPRLRFRTNSIIKIDGQTYRYWLKSMH